MQIESYNSFAHNYYGQGGVSPDELYNILKNNLPTIKNINYDLIILDEMQDMQLIFYKLITFFVNQ